MITAGTIGGPAYLEMIEDMDGKLNDVADDFSCAVEAEKVHLANESSEPSFSQTVDIRA